MGRFTNKRVVRQISAAEFEAALPGILINVAAGDEFVITHNETGKPIACVEPHCEPMKVTIEELSSE